MKIALIAMSGIRACDEELLEMGLTLPGFVERSQTIASLPSLGLLTLAGATPDRHEVKYIEVAELSQADEIPTDFDLVAISSFTAQANESYELARRFTARGIPVVMGGLHVTSLPFEPREHGIIPVAGEGELVWAEILEDAEKSRLAPFYDARRREFDLAEAPMPAFELLDIEKYNRLTVQTSRGCPWKCSFCASSILLTDRYKQKPIPRVLEEIDAIRNVWPRPFIEFADDNAFVRRDYWKALCRELATRNFRWFVETDISFAEDVELIRALRAAGCVEVLVGLESPSLEGLSGVERKSDWKRRQFPRYKEAIRRIQSHGIRVNACFVVGLDGHGPGIFKSIEEFVEEVAPFDVQITYPTPFPGTPLYAELKRSGRLRHDGEWGRFTLFDINFEPDPMSRAELRQGFHELSRSLYSDECTRWRKDEFHQSLRKAGSRARMASSALVS